MILGSSAPAAEDAEVAASTVADAVLSADIPYFIMAKGVAVATTSGLVPVKVAIWVGQEVKSIALAASAGFMKLEPKPPKNCFTTIMAKAEPIIGNHQGALAGKLKAINIPVIIAENMNPTPTPPRKFLAGRGGWQSKYSEGE